MIPRREYLNYLTFPADKNSLITQATERHLPQEFINELDRLPDQTYVSDLELINTYKLYGE